MVIYVLNIISDSNIGGAGRCVLNFLKYYDRERFRVKVVVPEGSLLKAEVEKLDTECIEAKIVPERSYDKSAVNKLKEIIKKENPDIVHTHGSLSGRIAAKKCGKKIIYTRHSVFPVDEKMSHGLGKFINKITNEYLSDRIIAVAEAAKNNLTEGGIDAKKIDVILNGVEKVEECSEEEKNETRRKYGIMPEDFVIGILARIEPYKGHKYLVDASQILKSLDRKIKVIIAGTGSYEEEVKDYVKKNNLEDTIIFAGFVKEIRQILGIIDVQVNASYGTEATSLALLEGMSLGIPAVVSDYGGNPGVITNGENGYIFKLKDSEDMAKYLDKLYLDKDIYNNMQKRAVEIFNEKFTAQIYADNICHVYENVMKG